MSTLTDQIAELERQLLRIEHTAESYIGGAKSYHSGYAVEYKPAIARKVAKINAELNALYDLCEA